MNSPPQLCWLDDMRRPHGQVATVSRRRPGVKGRERVRTRARPVKALELAHKELSGSFCTYSISLKPTSDEFWSTRPCSKISASPLRSLNKRFTKVRKQKLTRQMGNSLRQSFPDILFTTTVQVVQPAAALNSSDRFLRDTHLPPTVAAAALQPIRHPHGIFEANLGLG